MATKKKEEMNEVTAEAVEQEAPVTHADPMKELVDFYAFKDSGKYKDDIIVGINGKFLRIMRGVKVQIPRAYYEVLMQSQEQDAKTANLMEGLQEEYEQAKRILG